MRAPLRRSIRSNCSPIAGPEAVTNSLVGLPGVSLYDDQGARLQPELEIRGFSASSIVGTPQGIGVFLDGIRMNEPDAQEVDFDLIPSAAIDRASLDRGSNVLFGRNSLGGTLLMTTKRGEDQPEMTAAVGGGSFGEQLATVTAGGKADGFDGFVAASGENEVGWKEFSSGNTGTSSRRSGASGEPPRHWRHCARRPLWAGPDL